MYNKNQEDILKEKAKIALQKYQSAENSEGISYAFDILRYTKKGLYSEKSSILETLTIQEIASYLLEAFESPHTADKNVKGFSDVDWNRVYGAMTQDHKESLEITGQHDWPSLLVTALEEISNTDDNK